MSTRPQTLAPPAPSPAGASPAPPARRSGSSSLTKPWHGLPVWAWVVGGTVAAYLLWTKVLHKSSSSTSGVPSGAVGTTAPAGGGNVKETFPTGGSYTGPASAAPRVTPGKPASTTPAPHSTPIGPTRTTNTYGRRPKTTPFPHSAPTPITGTFQRAPSFTPHASATGIFTPIKTWAQTLGLASTGTQVYLWTTSQGRAVPTSLATLKALEHTGTHQYPQFTTYTKATSGGSAGLPRWVNPGGVEIPSGTTRSGTHLVRYNQGGYATSRGGMIQA